MIYQSQCTPYKEQPPIYQSSYGFTIMIGTAKEGSCRKDFAEYGIGAQNVAVNSQSGGYVLKLDKDCFQEDFINGADYLFAFYMNPAPDYETIGPLAADQPWIYLKITDGTNTTYFPLKFKIYDDPDG